MDELTSMRVTSADLSDRQSLASSGTSDSARIRLGRRLRALGALGVIASVTFGLVGWILVGRVTDVITTTFEPMSDLVTNISDTIEASQILVSRTTDALTSIESATRSTARTVASVNEVLGRTAELAGDEIADGLDSAVGSLPGLISTARVVDRTMRTLSLLGVDYDPEEPLDESLAALEASLRPVPDQIRDQADLLEDARSDIELIVTDAEELATVLLETRTDMMEAELSLADAAANAAEASTGVIAIGRDLETYANMARAVVTSAALTLVAIALAPLLIGTHFVKSEGAGT